MCVFYLRAMHSLKLMKRSTCAQQIDLCHTSNQLLEGLVSAAQFPICMVFGIAHKCRECMIFLSYKR